MRGQRSENESIRELVDNDELLNRQLESYHNLRDQAQLLFRTLVAVFAVVTTLIREDIFSFISSLQVPNKPITAAGEMQYPGMYQDLAALNLLIAAGVAMIAIVLFLDALAAATRILLAPSLSPNLGKSAVLELSWRERLNITNKSRYNDYPIWYNNAVLTRMNVLLRLTYLQIIESVVVSLYVLALITAAYNGFPNILVTLDIILITGGLIMVFYALIQVARSIINNQSGTWLQTVRKVFKDQLYYLQWAPSGLALVFIAPFYLWGVWFAFIAADIWLRIVWLT